MNGRIPRPRWVWTSALASKLCPVLNIQPQPESVFQVFSPPQGQDLLVDVAEEEAEGGGQSQISDMHRSPKRMSLIGMENWER